MTQSLAGGDKREGGSKIEAARQALEEVLKGCQSCQDCAFEAGMGRTMVHRVPPIWGRSQVKVSEAFSMRFFRVLSEKAGSFSNISE